MGVNSSLPYFVHFSREREACRRAINAKCMLVSAASCHGNTGCGFREDAARQDLAFVIWLLMEVSSI